MSKIKHIYARQVLDSRGFPTIESTVILSDGASATSSIPSGDSRGTYEALELRDNDVNHFQGMGVLNAVSNVNDIIFSKIEGMEAFNQQAIDKAMIELDGTQNKGRLGANAILSVSQATFKAAAKSSLLPLSLYTMQFLNSTVEKKIPIPMFNILEGGKHAPHSINIQECLIIPASSKSYDESLEIGVNVYQSLKKLLEEKGLSTLVAQDGGFTTDSYNNEQALSLVKSAIDSAGYSFTLDVFMGLDITANNLKDGRTYRLKDRSSPYTVNDLIDFYQNLSTEFSLIYLEDPMAEDDWEGWKKLYSVLGNKVLLAGDDLTVTNPYRLQLALDNNVIGGIVIKPNQIGTVSEAIAVCEIARYKNLKIIVSNRGGETMDDFIADFAVGVGADYVKFGSPARERVAKYNRLSEIEKEMNRI